MANLISLLRVLLAMVTLSLLWIPTSAMYWWAFGLTIIVIWMDGLDGYVARKLNEASKLGAVIDILGDRVVEQLYWIAFLALGWVPVWVPMVVIVRGVVVDGLRSIGFERGYTAFGATSMMQSKWGVFLVSSRASRWLYAACKALAFSLLIIANLPPALPDNWQWVRTLAYIAVYGAVLFCVLRGLPVLVEATRFFKSPNPSV